MDQVWFGLTRQGARYKEFTQQSGDQGGIEVDLLK